VVVEFVALVGWASGTASGGWASAGSASRRISKPAVIIRAIGDSIRDRHRDVFPQSHLPHEHLTARLRAPEYESISAGESSAGSVRKEMRAKSDVFLSLPLRAC
jgi:hypothetical protein